MSNVSILSNSDGIRFVLKTLARTISKLKNFDFLSSILFRNVKTDVNECTFGVETELTGPRGNPYKATVTKESATKWTIKG